MIKFDLQTFTEGNNGAMKAFGTKFKRDDTVIAKVVSIDGPSMEREEIEVTAHDSEDGFREFVPGLADAGEISLELRFIPTDASHLGLLSDFEDGTEKNYKLEFPDETEWSFDGFPTSFEPTAEMEDVLSASVTIKLTGKPTLVTEVTE